ncbi:hypothetical protein QYF36_000513 [Acer negundo]|nr:hypothetical protein QYF36_000513 [Acer negundo]
MASLPSISLLLLLLTLFSSQTHLTLSLLDHSRPSLPLLHSIADVHDLLTLYGLPKGLLPGNIESYTLQNDTGSFSIHLTGSCYVDFNPLVYYGKKITGRLSYGAVTDISEQSFYEDQHRFHVRWKQACYLCSIFIYMIVWRKQINSFTILSLQYIAVSHTLALVSKAKRNEKNDKKSDTKRKERMVIRRFPVEDGKGDINELADAFIKNFRNQLRIQREESFRDDRSRGFEH